MREESGYEPDIIVLNEPTIGNEPRWEKLLIITRGWSVPLIVEVTSPNGRDHYGSIPILQVGKSMIKYIALWKNLHLASQKNLFESQGAIL